MESCRERTVGREQVANLIKTVRLFELRCLTAYEYALISLQPCNPIHIMFCVKETAQTCSGGSPAGSFPVKAARCPGQGTPALHPCCVGQLASPHVWIFCTFRDTLRRHCLSGNSRAGLHSWLMFHSPHLGLWGHLYKWPRSSLNGAWCQGEELTYFGNNNNNNNNKATIYWVLIICQLLTKVNTLLYYSRRVYNSPWI